MKYCIICFLLFSPPGCLYSQPDVDKMLGELHNAIKQSSRLDEKKQAAIEAIKTRHNNGITHPAADFAVYRQLYEEYKVFRYDSAYSYAVKLEETAHRLWDTSGIAYARLQLSFCLLSAGMFKETYESLQTIDPAWLPDTSRAAYYSLLGRFYYDLGDFDNDKYHTPGYIIKGNSYLDSALLLMAPASFDYLYFTGLKQLKSGDKANALSNFIKILAWPALTDRQIAVAASTLSDIYVQNGETNKAIELLIKAVIADIQSSTKETSASFSLANILYKKGDVKNASVCIELAMEDAAFYGARQRKVRMSDILPLIEGEKLSLVESQKNVLITYAVIVTLLLVAVIWLVTVILKQVKKLKTAQKAVTEAHLKEQEINHRLAETNNKLTEANKIKEEYLGYFFNVNSDFFDKIERFKNSLEQKVSDRKIDEIKFLVNGINLRREKEYLVQNFDRVFLKLFPNFLDEFNELFTEENRVKLKDDELLNTDLRIFALIRMGIHDNDKIARILQYSVHTINTYKTKIKNRSFVSNEEFEKRIMQIKSI